MNTKRIFFIFLLFTFLWGCQEVFEADLTNKKVTLSSPANNVISDSTVQTFYWQQVTSANKYELQIVSPVFDSITRLVYDTTVQNTIFSVSLIPGRYQWRVRASSSSSTTSFSDSWNLTIQ